MPKNRRIEGAGIFRLVSSGTKIWNQFMMFVVVGVLPILFPQWIFIENRIIIFIIVVLALITSFIYEVWRTYLKKRKKDTSLVINLQLLTSLVLLTGFLHFFGRINGPFFVLYLLMIMESFLNRNIFLSNIIVSTMIFSTSVEFAWLVYQKEVVFGFISLIELVIRILSIVFMGAYGFVLAQKIISEGEAHIRTEKSTGRLEKVTRDLRKANVKLKELSALKDEFVSVASHELRAPMTMIKGYISMILEGDAGKIPPRVKEFLKDTFESNDRMIRLVNNMLNVSRIESGRLVMGLKDIQIEKAIKEVVKNFQLEGESHGLELKYIEPKKKLPKVRVDPDRIREVISNLVGNAVNFTPHGHIHVRSYEKNGMVTVEVEDTGVGIAPKDQKQLFKKFSQIGAGTPLKKGSGLGLYICRMLVNEFGGKIWVKSRVGKGTSFYFNLPAIVNHRQRK